VNIVPDGRLGDYRDFTKLVESNVIQAAIVSIDAVAVRYPAASVTRRPYTFDSTEAAQAVFGGPFGRRLASEIERHTDFVVLGLADRGGFTS
jgi:TRAP-type C4-dicarboxylate transport system substrate-binding protein